MKKALLLILQASVMFGATVVKLTPPVLNEETIRKEVACTRPMRDGAFNISFEQIGNKKIINCYGHGGSGWTTLFGSVRKAIQLFAAQHPDQNIPIRVIGSGCMGLTSAIELGRAGFQVKISSKELYDLPSWRGTGYLAIVSVKTSPEEQEDLNKIGVATFRAYESIGKGFCPFVSRDAVRYLPVYCSKDTESGLEDLEARKLIPQREEVTLDFGAVQHENFVKYMTYFIDTTKLMQQFTAEVKRLGIPITVETIHSFDDVEEEIIFNCAGLGGRELCQDSKMIPVRGHLLLLNDKAGTEHMDYMIYTKVYQDGKPEYVYMFPKSVAVSSDAPEGVSHKAALGGTFIPNADTLSPEELKKLDRIEFQRMLERSVRFFHGS